MGEDGSLSGIPFSSLFLLLTFCVSDAVDVLWEGCGCQDGGEGCGRVSHLNNSFRFVSHLILSSLVIRVSFSFGGPRCSGVESQSDPV